jgi:hypothetical protein
MGRELKRVALDFKWPENKVWDGYLNPHYAKSHDCPECAGSGSSPEAQRLANLWNCGWSHHLNADDVAALLED